MCIVTARAVGTEATRTTYVLNRNADVLHTFEGGMYVFFDILSSPFFPFLLPISFLPFPGK